VWGDADDLDHVPQALIERLRHYFLTYKLVPGEENRVRIQEVYTREHALRVIIASMEDYQAAFGKENEGKVA
jgi:inorganic pyrophosphatase